MSRESDYGAEAHQPDDNRRGSFESGDAEPVTGHDVTPPPARPENPYTHPPYGGEATTTGATNPLDYQGDDEVGRFELDLNPQTGKFEVQQYDVPGDPPTGTGDYSHHTYDASSDAPTPPTGIPQVPPLTDYGRDRSSGDTPQTGQSNPWRDSGGRRPSVAQTPHDWQQPADTGNEAGSESKADTPKAPQVAQKIERALRGAGRELFVELPKDFAYGARDMARGSVDIWVKSKRPATPDKLAKMKGNRDTLKAKKDYNPAIPSKWKFYAGAPTTGGGLIGVAAASGSEKLIGGAVALTGAAVAGLAVKEQWDRRFGYSIAQRRIAREVKRQGKAERDMGRLQKERSAIDATRAREQEQIKAYGRGSLTEKARGKLDKAAGKVSRQIARRQPRQSK